MLNESKNLLLNVLVHKEGLNPGAFSSAEKNINEDSYFYIFLKNSPLKFAIKDNFKDGNFQTFSWFEYTKFSPRFPVKILEIKPKDIHAVCRFFEKWIDKEVLPYLKNVKTPNLWDKITQHKSLAGELTMPLSDREPFTAQEKEQLREGLSVFQRKLLIEFKHSQEQAELITERINYLTDSLDRLHRIDWKSLVISTLVSISIALSLDTMQGNRLLEMFMSVTQHALKMLE